MICPGSSCICPHDKNISWAGWAYGGRYLLLSNSEVSNMLKNVNETADWPWNCRVPRVLERAVKNWVQWKFDHERTESKVWKDSPKSNHLHHDDLKLACALLPQDSLDRSKVENNILHIFWGIYANLRRFLIIFIRDYIMFNDMLGP